MWFRRVTWRDNAFFTGKNERDRLRDLEAEPERYQHIWEGLPDDGDATRHVLTFDMMAKCVEAYKKSKAPPRGARPSIAGLDIAEGGTDRCALVIGTGPTIEYLDVWPGTSGDLRPAAQRAHEACLEHGVKRLYYDASSPMRGEFLRLGAPYEVRPCNFGGEVAGGDVIYERGRPPRFNKDVFRSLNIQMATAVRLRASRTVQLMKGHDVDPDRCLFIRDDFISPESYIRDVEKYFSELAQPTRRTQPGSGRWELDKRGGDENADSPDSFDATCLAFRADCNRLRAL